MLKIAMVMADFSGDEAEELRRALSFHRSEERMKKVSVKLRAAMERKGVSRRTRSTKLFSRSRHLRFTDFPNRMPSVSLFSPTAARI